jgi:hypothetical protein
MCLTLLHDHAREGGDGQSRHNVEDLADPKWESVTSARELAQREAILR